MCVFFFKNDINRQFLRIVDVILTSLYNLIYHSVSDHASESDGVAVVAKDPENFAVTDKQAGLLVFTFCISIKLIYKYRVS